MGVPLMSVRVIVKFSKEKAGTLKSKQGQILYPTFSGRRISHSRIYVSLCHFDPAASGVQQRRLRGRPILFIHLLQLDFRCHATVP